MLKNSHYPPNKIHTGHHTLRNLALLLSPTPYTNNSRSGHTEFLSISHVHTFLNDFNHCTRNLAKIIRWQEGHMSRSLRFKGLLLWPSSGRPSPPGRQSVEPRSHAGPEAARPLLDHTPGAQGSRAPCRKDPSLLLWPAEASFHVHPPEGSPHHRPDHFQASGWPWGSCL